MSGQKNILLQTSIIVGTLDVIENIQCCDLIDAYISWNFCYKHTIDYPKEETWHNIQGIDSTYLTENNSY